MRINRLDHKRTRERISIVCHVEQKPRHRRTDEPPQHDRVFRIDTQFRPQMALVIAYCAFAGRRCGVRSERVASRSVCFAGLSRKHRKARRFVDAAAQIKYGERRNRPGTQHYAPGRVV